MDKWLHHIFLSKAMVTPLQHLAVTYGANILFALMIALFGWWFAALVKRIVKKACVARSVDETISAFVSHLIYILLLVAITIGALSRLGIPTASLVAVVGAAGLAVGLSLRGTLSNFASGIIIIATRPFRIKDHVKVASTEGRVMDVNLMFTHVRTHEGPLSIVPNGKITSAEIINYSKLDRRRMELTVGAAGDQFEETREMLMKLLASDKRFLSKPAPEVMVSELAGDGVKLVVRAWTKLDHFSPAKHALVEVIRKTFDKAKIPLS
jgi:small conductance mechanosensitive channel